MSVDWQSASERLHHFISMDADLRHDLVALGKEQARDDKLAFKLEEGRTYGMRQQFYQNKLKRDLARSLRRQDVTEEHW
jgi:2,4-dienoyl-CoA reductase-like NADH-dependent reductase (Old Yellow Enzyme family)